MTLTLDISDDLKPDEASELVEIARSEQLPIGSLLLKAARELVARRRGEPVTQAEPVKAAA